MRSPEPQPHTDPWPPDTWQGVDIALGSAPVPVAGLGRRAACWAGDRTPARGWPSVARVTVIEVFADIWCPFAYVGLSTVMRRRGQSGADGFFLRVRAWPLELVNGRPLDPAATAGHVDELRSQVAPDLFAQFDPGRFPTSSLPGLALAAAAYRAGDRTGEAVSMALRTALFEEGLDISRPDVLAGHRRRPRRGRGGGPGCCRRTLRLARGCLAWGQGIATLLLWRRGGLLPVARHPAR